MSFTTDAPLYEITVHIQQICSTFKFTEWKNVNIVKLIFYIPVVWEKDFFFFFQMYFQNIKYSKIDSVFQKHMVTFNITLNTSWRLHSYDFIDVMCVMMSLWLCATPHHDYIWLYPTSHHIYIQHHIMTTYGFTQHHIMFT